MMRDEYLHQLLKSSPKKANVGAMIIWYSQRQSIQEGVCSDALVIKTLPAPGLASIFLSWGGGGGISALVEVFVQSSSTLSLVKSIRQQADRLISWFKKSQSLWCNYSHTCLQQLDLKNKSFILQNLLFTFLIPAKENVIPFDQMCLRYKVDILRVCARACVWLVREYSYGAYTCIFRKIFSCVLLFDYIFLLCIYSMLQSYSKLYTFHTGPMFLLKSVHQQESHFYTQNHTV